jgi:hypothetical protein
MESSDDPPSELSMSDSWQPKPESPAEAPPPVIPAPEADSPTREGIYLVAFVVSADLLTPAFLCGCSIATTSILGLVFQVILVLHFVVISRFSHREGIASLSLWIALILELALVVSALSSLAKPDTSHAARLAAQ